MALINISCHVLWQENYRQLKVGLHVISEALFKTPVHLG